MRSDINDLHGLNLHHDNGRGFCDFYCKVGTNLAAKIRSEGDGAFAEYLGDKVTHNLYWCPTTPTVNALVLPHLQ